MATLYGNQYQQGYIDVPVTKVYPGEVSGDIKYMFFDYNIPGVAPTNGDIIKLGKIPQGAKIYDCLINFPDLGSAGTLDVGQSAGASGSEALDADAFIASVDVNTAADAASMQQQALGGAAPAGFLKVMAEEVDLQITVTAAWTSTTTTQKINGFLAYVTI